MVDPSSGERSLRLLQEVAAALSTAGALEGLPAVAARLAAVHGARRAAVLALPDAASALVFQLAASDDPEPQRLPLSLQDLPAVAATISSGRAVLAPAPASDPPDGDLAGGTALLAVPLLCDGDSIGCLALHLPAGAVPDEEQRAVLASVGQMVAVALRGPRALDVLREQTGKLSVQAIGEQRRDVAIDGYREFFDGAADGVVVLDARGTVLHINRAVEHLTGYARTGMRGRCLFDFVPAPEREALAAAVDRAAAGEPLAGFDFAIVTTSGETLRLSASTSAVLREHGAAVLAVRDVTEARALQDELRNTRDFLLRLIDSAVDGIVAADMRGNVILFNRGAARVFGWTADEIIGHVPVWQLYPEGVARELMTELRDPRNQGRLTATRCEVVARGGERIPIELAASVVYQDGEEVATFGIFTDLRDRLRIEHSLAEAQARLVVSEKQAMIAELAGATAHELNQPLTSVTGYAELLLRRLGEGDANRRAVEIVLREAERMAEIVRKIGKITHYESKPYVGTASIIDLEKAAGE